MAMVCRAAEIIPSLGCHKAKIIAKSQNRKQSIDKWPSVGLGAHSPIGWDKHIMASPNECRDFAQESLCWAQTAKSERESAIFLQMAHAWLLAAAKLEGRQVHVPEDPKGMFLVR
jgi:hypothetical protein